MQGLIFSVKRYSVHDGPGIRVTFFLKGCPCKCIWCHNPEGISAAQETVVTTDRIGEKEFHKIEEAGKFYTTASIIEILDKEKIFINQSRGGVTFSGGEPMNQTQFLTEALKSCKLAGYHTAVDTSGYAPAENFKAVMPYTDLFLFDLKHTDDSRHLQLTGVSNSVIIENFRMLSNSGADLIVRIPIVPGMNDDSVNLERLKMLINSVRKDAIKGINLLPFHKTGASKYQKFHLLYKMKDVAPPTKERMKELKEFFADTGINVKIGG